MKTIQLQFTILWIALAYWLRITYWQAKYHRSLVKCYIRSWHVGEWSVRGFLKIVWTDIYLETRLTMRVAKRTHRWGQNILACRGNKEELEKLSDHYIAEMRGYCWKTETNHYAFLADRQLFSLAYGLLTDLTHP